MNPSLKNIASVMSIFVGIRLGSFLLGICSLRANEVGVFAGSIGSVIMILACKMLAVAWPWYAPVGSISFLVIAMVVSRYFGVLSPEQYRFATEQKGLFCKPALSHYGLLIFCLFTLLLCAYLPEIFLFLLV